MHKQLALVVTLLCLSYSANSLPVYTDSVASPFVDWSWAGTKNAAATTFVHGGTASYSFTPASWGAIYFEIGTPIVSTNYAGLSFFYLNTGANDTITVAVVDASSKVLAGGLTVSKYTLNTPVVNKWVQGTISFGSSPMTISGCWFQDATGLTSNPTVYIDDVSFVERSTSTSTSAKATTSTSSPLTTTSAKVTTSTSTTTAKAATTSSSTSAKAATTTSTSATATTTSTSAKATTTTSTSAKVTTTSSSTSAKAATTSTSTSAKAATTSSSTSSKPSTTTTTGGSTTGVSGNWTTPDSAVQTLYGNVQTGKATYYGQYTNGGECGLDPTPPAGLATLETVAIATSAYLRSETCGMCVSITGTGTGSGATPVVGTFIVFVNNECPDCNPGSIDLGVSGDGLWDITWQAVPCPISSNIEYVIKTGSSVYWIGIQVRNYRYPVQKFEIKANGAFMTMPRQTYNYYESSVSGIVFPLVVRLTCVTGQILTDSIPALTIGTVQSGGVQFSL